MSVRVILIGGHANQCWQLAAAMTLVGPNHLEDIKVDCTLLEAYRNTPGITPRAFALGQFGFTPGGTASQQEVLCHESLPNSYDPTQNYLLRGYFQRLEYFNPWIRNWLKSRLPPMKRQDRTLAVHVRRGDYVLNPNATAFHGVMPLDYYVRAAHRLVASGQVDRIAIYSDDRSWCLDYLLPVLGSTVSVSVSTEPLDPWVDIAGMAACSHHVVPNSTFGHLGALLADSRGVVYPTKWFTYSPAPPIFPENWICLE